MSNIDSEDRILKIYFYILLFMMVYSLFVGFKLQDMLRAKEDISSLLKAAHSHILCNSFLMLFLVYDSRIRLSKEKSMPFFRTLKSILGIGIIGHILTTIGFSIAGFVPSLTGNGMSIAGIGEPMMFFSLFLYIIISIIGEVYK
ncbi:MAG: hypothetical protein V1660_03575 [archaeon]